MGHFAAAACLSVTLLTTGTLALVNYWAPPLGDEAAVETPDSWGWRCQSGKCVRGPESGAGGVGTRPTLALCRLTCGAAGALWPRPTGAVALADALAPFDPRAAAADVAPAAGGADARRFLRDAAALAFEGMKRECRLPPANASTLAAAAPAGQPSLLVIFHTNDPSLTLRQDTNESYTLDLTSQGGALVATIRAETVYGARHALETLSQLTACAPAASAPGATMFAVARASVADAPRYSHRGLLLDTSRHWLPERALRKTIDALAAVKMNVLHWHATDSHSFPLQLPRVPQLARYGAYSPQKTYSAAAVARLARYARARGVRLLVEIDGPSHAGNGWQWGPDAGLGELASCINSQPWRSYCIQPPCGQLNPANAAVYGVLRDVFRDLLDALPPDEMLHLGGDEVFLPCWNATPAAVAWVEARGLGRDARAFYTLWAYFHAEELKALDQARGHARGRAVLWSSHLTEPEHIEEYLDKNRFIIQTWVEGSSRLSEELLARGYDVIITTKDAWYLDHGFWGYTRYHNWRDAYEAGMPRPARVARAGVGRVLGGEAAMWGELVDEQGLDGRVWPRAAAVAERLWSDPSTGASVAESRLLQMRERLVRRGVRASAITPEWCLLNEGQCN